MRKKRLVAAVTAVVLAWSCSDQSHFTEPRRVALSPSAVPFFNRALTDVNSLANAHNRYLDTVLTRLRAKRLSTNRRSTVAELCELKYEVAVEHASRSGATVVRKEGVGQYRGCQKLTLKRERAREPYQGLRAAGWTPEDYLDSLIAPPYDTTDFEGLNRISEDSAEFRALYDDLVEVISTGEDSAAVVEGIETIVQQVAPSDTIIAEIIGESSALAYNSVNYWSENLDDWIEELCEEPDPELRSRGMVEEDPCGCEPPESQFRSAGAEDPPPCDPPESLRAKGQMESWLWDLVGPTALADLSSVADPFLAILGELQEASDYWQGVGGAIIGGQIVIPSEGDMKYFTDNLGPYPKQEFVDRAKNMVPAPPPPPAPAPPPPTKPSMLTKVGNVAKGLAKGVGAAIGVIIVGNDSMDGMAEACLNHNECLLWLQQH